MIFNGFFLCDSIIVSNQICIWLPRKLELYWIVYFLSMKLSEKCMSYNLIITLKVETHCCSPKREKSIVFSLNDTRHTGLEHVLPCSGYQYLRAY